MADTLKIAIVTDIHYGRDSGARLGSKAPRLMRKFAKAVHDYKPDIVVDMGDRINASNSAEAQDNLRKLTQHFNDMAAPVHYLLGNHDLKYLSAQDNAVITGGSLQSYSKDIKGCHLVFWNPSVDATGKEGLRLSKEDLSWLEDDLAKTSKPAIVFSHVPLDEHNAEDDTIVKRFYYDNAKAAQKIMERSGKVILAMGGHRHQSQYKEIGGIHYVTQQALTSMYKKHYRVASDTFSFLEVEGRSLRLLVKGKAGKSHNWPVPTSPV